MKLSHILPFALLLSSCAVDTTRWYGTWKGKTKACTAAGIPVTIEISDDGKADDPMGELTATTTLGFYTASMDCNSAPVEVDLSGMTLDTDVTVNCGGTRMTYALSVEMNTDETELNGTFGIPFLMECNIALAKQ